MGNGKPHPDPSLAVAHDPSPVRSPEPECGSEEGLPTAHRPTLTYDPTPFRHQGNADAGRARAPRRRRHPHPQPARGPQCPQLRGPSRDRGAGEGGRAGDRAGRGAGAPRHRGGGPRVLRRGRRQGAHGTHAPRASPGAPIRAGPLRAHRGPPGPVDRGHRRVRPRGRPRARDGLHLPSRDRGGPHGAPGDQARARAGLRRDPAAAAPRRGGERTRHGHDRTHGQGGRRALDGARQPHRRGRPRRGGPRVRGGAHRILAPRAAARARRGTARPRPPRPRGPRGGGGPWRAFVPDRRRAGRNERLRRETRSPVFRDA